MVTLAEAMVNVDAKIERLMDTNNQIMAQLALISIASNNQQQLPPPAIAREYMAPAVRAPPRQYTAPPANYSVPPVTQVTISTQGGYNNNQQPWQGRGRGRTGGGGRVKDVARGIRNKPIPPRYQRRTEEER
jgi:hypothetical protein